MNTHRSVMIAVLVGVGVAGVAAQQPAARDEVGQLMESIKDLKWEDVDYSAQSSLQRCRVLMLLNHALDEVGAAAAAEADLMSEFVDMQGLGQAFASEQLAGAGPARTYEDAQRIAVALLQGPMSASRYSTALADTDERGLQSYERLYDETCRRKWSEFAEPMQHVRSMAAFLKAKSKRKDYLAWAEAEFDRRQQQYETEMAERRAAAKGDTEQEEQARLERLRQKQAEKEQEGEAESLQAQQALYAAHQPQVIVEVDDDDGWHAGWYHGHARRAHRRAWHQDTAHRTQVRERTDERLDNWQRSGREGGQHSGRKGGRRP
jgi:hypothetical protein